ncbi:helix-turn-helix domain-containing protein [Nonomuraea typhae]|uniref:Helix-turn-helix domain-containing protein n=1 Tax=Nonomuraea typhae TaxID=2603600 RepID=A0ABW7YS00_9ACTN
MEKAERRPYRMGARAAAMEATRTHILRTAVALWMQHWYDEVTLADIAKAAEVSVQTIVNRFGGKEGLADAAADWLAGRVADDRRAPAGDVKAIVAVLIADYELHGDANARWGVDAERIPAIARAIAGARSQHRAWLEQVFSDRLPAGGPAREHALNLHYAATDVALWKLWRRDLGLSREETERAMHDMVIAIDPRRSSDE